MDVSGLLQSQWLTASEVNNSPTKMVTLLSMGEEVEEKNKKSGETYKAVKFLVSLDKVEKTWKPNRYSLKKLASMFGNETKDWVGKSFSVKTIPTQGGGEGVAPA